MAWWTKVDGVLKKHDGPKPKLRAVVEISFANAAGKRDLHLYRQDPEKHPDAEDQLPGLMAKAWKRVRP